MTAITTATLRRTVCSSANDGDFETKDTKGTAVVAHENELVLVFLGCEALPPYGPYDHTASLFLDLIASAVAETLAPNRQRLVVLEVYAVSEAPTTGAQDRDRFARFPSVEDLTKCDGVILPGSFSSAYDEDKPWIMALRDWIQTNLVAFSIPTLGVCFGHQLYAHSFSGASNDGLGGDDERKNDSAKDNGSGIAVECPAGPQAGRKTIELTATGRAFLDAACHPTGIDNRDAHHHHHQQQHHRTANNNTNNHTIAGTTAGLELFYTHGDMVKSLPSCGVSLGGNENVPIQAALYFSAPVANSEDVLRGILRGTPNNSDDDQHKKDNPRGSGPKVIAVTFQAHPEFAALGTGTKGDETLHGTMKLMKDNGNLSEQEFVAAETDAVLSAMRVREQSINAIISAGRLLDWFRPNR